MQRKEPLLVYFRYLSVHLGPTSRIPEFHALISARSEDATCGAGRGTIVQSGAVASKFRREGE